MVEHEAAKAQNRAAAISRSDKRMDILPGGRLDTGRPSSILTRGRSLVHSRLTWIKRRMFWGIPEWPTG
jgi:hypothetical protein